MYQYNADKDAILLAELAGILQDNSKAKAAAEAIWFAASQVRGTMQPIADAYKVYLASGNPAYSPKGLASVCVEHEKMRTMGLPAVLTDMLYHGPVK
jgi:hypothetical protein